MFNVDYFSYRHSPYGYDRSAAGSQHGSRLRHAARRRVCTALACAGHTVGHGPAATQRRHRAPEFNGHNLLDLSSRVRVALRTSALTAGAVFSRYFPEQSIRTSQPILTLHRFNAIAHSHPSLANIVPNVSLHYWTLSVYWFIFNILNYTLL